MPLAVAAVTPDEYRRGLRGVVLHVLPRVRERFAERDVTAPRWSSGAGRDLIGPASNLRSDTWGTCRWCELPCKRGHKWHSACFRMFCMARGQTMLTGRHETVVKRADCALCGKEHVPVTRHKYGEPTVHPHSLDHALAIGVAKLIDAASWARAYLPTNLRWLCHGCHVAKTKRDRRRMKWLSYSGPKRRPAPKPKPPPPPMFPEL